MNEKIALVNVGTMSFVSLLISVLNMHQNWNGFLFLSEFSDQYFAASAVFFTIIKLKTIKGKKLNVKKEEKLTSLVEVNNAYVQ